MRDRTPEARSIAPRPSYVGIPADEKRPVLLFLCERFPRIAKEVWLSRLERGLVRFESGQTVDPTTPCRAERLLYFRELDEERRLVPNIGIRHETETFLVADKPAGVPVVPSGGWVRESLLYRMIELTGDETLQPAHRIDVDTSGLVLFSRGGKDVRTRYHRLFAAGEVTKVYRAIAHWSPARLDSRDDARRYWRIESQIIPDEPWFRRRSSREGIPNAVSDVFVEKIEGDRVWFRVLIETGKQHQVRVHLTSLGCPIVGDRYYPVLRETAAPPERLQLIAAEMAFRDPFTNERVWLRSLFELPLRSCATV